MSMMFKIESVVDVLTELNHPGHYRKSWLFCYFTRDCPGPYVVHHLYCQ